MMTGLKTLAGSLVVLSILAVATPGLARAPATHAGLVVSVDKAGGTFVMGDMGPLLPSGKSEVTRYTIQATAATEFVRVKRASGVAPSGWFGDWVETKLPALDVKPGDFVAVVTDGKGQRLKAVEVTVVDTSEP
jgi:hypothetical protein